MNVLSRSRRRDEGGIDFVQVVVGLLIIGIAAVGTLQALYYGYEQLDFQMRYRKAISIARTYTEYWQGRIHTDFKADDRQVRAGNLANPETWLLDRRDPNRTFDDITCLVSRGPLVPVDLPTTGLGVDHWWFRVYVQWWGPEEPLGRPPHEVTFYATIVPSAM